MSTLHCWPIHPPLPFMTLITVILFCCCYWQARVIIHTSTKGSCQIKANIGLLGYLSNWHVLSSSLWTHKHKRTHLQNKTNKKKTSGVLHVCVRLLTCSAPLWVQHLAGWETWPVVWSPAVRWHSRERHGQANWWNETDGVHGSHDDPSETHKRQEMFPHLGCIFYSGIVRKRFCLFIKCNSHLVSWWWQMHLSHKSHRCSFGEDWQEDISWFSSPIYNRDFRNLGSTMPRWL